MATSATSAATLPEPFHPFSYDDVPQKGQAPASQDQIITDLRQQLLESSRALREAEQTISRTRVAIAQRDQLLAVQQTKIQQLASEIATLRRTLK